MYAENNKQEREKSRENLWCVIPMTVMAGLKKKAQRKRTENRERCACKQRPAKVEQMIWEGITFIYYICMLVQTCNALFLARSYFLSCVWIHFASHPWPVRPNSNSYRKAWNNKTTTTTSLSAFPGYESEWKKNGENESKHIVAWCAVVH